MDLPLAVRGWLRMPFAQKHHIYHQTYRIQCRLARSLDPFPNGGAKAMNLPCPLGDTGGWPRVRLGIAGESASCPMSAEANCVCVNTY